MVTARSDAGRRLDHIYPRHRVRLELETYDADRGRRARRRRDRRLPARRRRARRRGPAEPRPEGRRPVRRLPARPRALRALLPAARGARRCSARSVYGLPDAFPFTVMERCGLVNYRLRKTAHSKPFVAHVDKLKPCFEDGPTDASENAAPDDGLRDILPDADPNFARPKRTIRRPARFQ